MSSDDLNWNSTVGNDQSADGSDNSTNIDKSADGSDNSLNLDKSFDNNNIGNDQSADGNNIGNDQSDDDTYSASNFGNDQSDDDIDVALTDAFNDKSDDDTDNSNNSTNNSNNDNSKTWTNQQSFAMDESVDVALDNVGNEDNSDTNSNNDNSDRSTDVDVALTDAFNDKSSTTTEIGIEDALNDKSVRDSNNDNSTSDSHDDNSTNDSGNDNSTNVDVALTDALNDKSIDSSYNSVSTDTSIEVGISDAFNEHTETYADSFNDSSTGFGEISVDFENVFNGAFGDGAGDGFAINQVADIVDNDYLHNVSQDNSGGFTMNAEGGLAAQVGWDNVENPFAEANGSGVQIADAGAQLSGSAFNMEIVLGSNLQQNAVDISIVGGSADNNDTTTTSGDSF
jgi:hypothetical protein